MVNLPNYTIMETQTFENYLNSGNYESCPKQKFLVFLSGKNVAIDNTQGEFFMEEFKQMEEAIKWLK